MVLCHTHYTNTQSCLIGMEEPLELILSNSSGQFSWLSVRKKNKIIHICMGNRGYRGKGINCLYWNKGPTFLGNKQSDIETIIKDHNPHVLGLGEANFLREHNLDAVKQNGYDLHLDACVDDSQLGVARVAVYTHNSIRVKRRHDLECKNVSAVWLECGLPHQKKILLCVGYRQWRLMGQKDNTSASINQQLARWESFLEMWEKALAEDKEVITTLDANLDFLTWRDDDLPPNHSSVKLRPLTDALFHKIMPLGVSQLIKSATRVASGQPKSGLDHLYTNQPDKLSSVQTFSSQVCPIIS